MNRHTDIIYMTDPICSYCWALEPVIRRMVLTYDCKIRYIHGGLLPNWDAFIDSANDIRSPQDVYHHWLHVSSSTGQPIDPSVWLDDPLNSSFPACHACIAVRLADPSKESAYLRLLREQVFVYAVNIAKQSVLEHCAVGVGISREEFRNYYHSERVKHIFIEESLEMKRYGAQGYPSIAFYSNGKITPYRGARRYDQFEDAYLWAKKHSTKTLQGAPAELLGRFKSWTLPEVVEVLGCEAVLARTELMSLGFIKRKVGDHEMWVK